jgi:DNA-binding winged helix-turn-helix (wHTH) protein/Tol biopolymer transport system component
MPCYQFGPFSLDSDRRRLRRNEEPLAITAKTFETLLTLVESPGRVVLKEELLERVWAGARTEEGSLTQSVFTVRKLLGDSAKEPQYIATIAGRGYQFVSPVSTTDSPKDTKKSELIQRTIVWQIAGVAGLICAGFVAYQFASRSGLPTVAGYTQITHDGVEKSLIGMGGNSLFFKKDQETLRLDLADGAEQTIRTAGQGTLNVSADGKALLWQTPFSAPVVESQLWRLPISGEAPRALSKAIGHDGAWSRNGKTLVYAHGTTLYLADGNGDHVRQIADLPGIARHFSWSPDDRLMRFDLLDKNSVSKTLWQIDMTDYKIRPLLDRRDGFSDACCGHWTADGAYFVFESGGQIWALDEEHPDNRAVQLTFSPMRLSTPIPGANSQQLFAVGKVLRGELLQYDPAGQKWIPFLHGISAEYVDVSPDEKWVAYVSFPQGVLWRSKLDGTERLALSAAPMHAFGPRWSRDGKKIVFSDRGSGRPSKLYVVNSDGDGLHELLSEDNESKVDGTLTPDGKKIIFGNDFTSARPALHVLNLETKTREDVPGSAGLFSPRLSPSGRYLVALPVDCQKLLVYDFHKKGWTTLAEGNFTSPDWSPDENFVYGGGSDKGRPAVVRIRVADRTMERVVYASGFQSTGSIGFWFGLGPGQSVIALHDTGIKDIYSLNWPRH